MKAITLKIALLFVLAQSLFLTLANPAQDLFDEAVYFLSLQYGGFAEVSPQTLAAKYQDELEYACNKQETCPLKPPKPSSKPC